VSRPRTPSEPRVRPADRVWVDSVLDPDEDVIGAPREPIAIAISGPNVDFVDRQLIRIDERLEIGRAGTEHPRRLIIRSDHVSRNHACIIPGESYFEVHDVGSANGVYVGGSRVGGVRLADNGSLIFVGPQVLILRFLSEAAIEAIEEDQHCPLLGVPTMSGRLALIHRRLRALASGGEPVMLSGSAGSGRASYARAIHNLSGRPGRFVRIDGAGLSSADAEQWLFGSSGDDFHPEGTPGGVLHQALNGTLFVNRLEDVPFPIQDRIAGVVTGLRLNRLTAERAVEAVPIRLIASAGPGVACRSPREMMISPRMRELMGARDVRLPSLVHRKEDIGTLCRYHLRRRPRWTISSRAWLSLCLYDWPGNLSELTTTLQGLLVEHAANEILRITERHLPHPLSMQVGPWRSLSATAADAANDPHQTPIEGHRIVGELNVTHARVVDEFSRRHRLSERQTQIIAGAIKGLSSKEIAAELNIDYRTVAEHLNRMLEKTGVSDRHQLVAQIVDLLIDMLNADPVEP
jgi:DNA-binding NtrC family response regulator